MNKRILSWLLSVILIIGLAVPATAEELAVQEVTHVRIINANGLVRLAENCRLDSYSRNLTVSLEADLDLTGQNFAGIPIFNGTFQGNGYTIRGLELTAEGSQQGLFRYLTDTAVVENLNLEGIVQPAGTASEVGGFVGRNSGTIRNCSFLGTVSGKEFVGGIAGQNSVSGILENCHTEGSVYGDHFIGGMAGKNMGVVRGCDNKASINETPQQNAVKLTDITMQSVVQSESANTVTDVGGIAGISSGMIRQCMNYGLVGHSSMGYNIGGIAGTQSGTVMDCENYGQIHGRKEVGGIVGQMEPSSVVEFEEDALQILSRQLDGMGKIVSQASSNLQGAGDRIIGQVGDMHYYVENAKDAVMTLIPTEENPNLPDQDTLQAARNGIGSSIVGMSNTIDRLRSTAFSALGAVSSNLSAMNNQINAMKNTISNAAETLGGSVVDVSDDDTDLDLTGKVRSCRNDGPIYADLNGGGITGAMAMENDLDIQEDFTITGDNSLNFESEIRAVILDCENTATVTVGKQNAGGVVGYQPLGLVKNSRNFGILDAATADYVGGISGQSTGFIRSSHANGRISGSTRVGGIAGSAAIATDCYSLVQLVDTVEKRGAILGELGENIMEEEDPVSGNYYLAVKQDPGAIDGISYDGQAQAMHEERFFLLEALPERFAQVLVTFRYDNGSVREFTIDVGSTFPADWVPPIPPKEGRQSYWKGLEEADLTGIFFDESFDQEYTTQTTVLESDLTRENLPLLFVQGIFAADAQLSVESSEEVPELKKQQTHLETWTFRTTQPQDQTQIRIRIPGQTDEEHLLVMIRDVAGSWRQETYHVLGRYAVVPLMPGDAAIALVQQNRIPWLAIGFASVIATASVWLIIRKKKSKG